MNELLEVSMKNLQRLSIQIFFSTNLKDEYERDAKKLLKRKSIPFRYNDYLPNVKDQSFVSESYGRRFLITREVFKRFKSLFSLYLKKEDIQISDVINSSLLNEYFESDYFFGCERSFPHYTGLGKGYENSSKFFFFIIDKFKDNFEFLLEAYTAISLHINFQATFSDVLFYEGFKKGVFFYLENKVFVVLDGHRFEIPKEKLPADIIYLNDVIEKTHKEAK